MSVFNKPSRLMHKSKDAPYHPTNETCCRQITSCFPAHSWNRRPGSYKTNAYFANRWKTHLCYGAALTCVGHGISKRVSLRPCYANGCPAGKSFVRVNRSPGQSSLQWTCSSCSRFASRPGNSPPAKLAAAGPYLKHSHQRKSVNLTWRKKKKKSQGRLIEISSVSSKQKWEERAELTYVLEVMQDLFLMWSS